jgi:hypothetical protein
VQAQRPERLQARAPLYVVLVTAGGRVRKPRRAAENGAEVVHVVPDVLASALVDEHVE